MLSATKIRITLEKAAVRVALGPEPAEHVPTVILLGPESSGKTALLDALSERRGRQLNVAGSTVSAELAEVRGEPWVDTPGLLHAGTTDAARRTVDVLATGPTATVLLVVPLATLAADLPLLLPSAGSRPVAVVASFADEADPETARRAVRAVARAGGVPVVGMDARAPSEEQKAALFRAVGAATPWHRTETPETTLLPVPEVAPVSRRGPYEHRFFGPVLGLLTLLAPAVLATWTGLRVSTAIEEVTGPIRIQASAAEHAIPSPWGELIAGQYGVLTMLPLLFVWAVPIVLLHAAGMAVAKASGLLDRASLAVEPLFRPFRLTGRDASRVVMGYGCNVPAIIQGRSCLSCTRASCSGAIAFGSACGYQLGAVLGVLSAAHQGALVFPYLLIVLAGALVCARWTAGRGGAAGRLLVRRAPLRIPHPGQVWRELSGPLRQVVRRVVPIFLAITVLASLLASSGVLDVLSSALQPVLAALGLPATVAPAVAAAALRKDGILLMATPAVLTTLTPGTLLASLVLASTVVPCAVTALTIAKEHGARTGIGILGRGVLVSVVLTALIAWGTTALGQ